MNNLNLDLITDTSSLPKSVELLLEFILIYFKEKIYKNQYLNN